MKNILKILLILTLVLGCSPSKHSKPEWYKNEAFLKALNFADFRDITGFIYASNMNLKSVDGDGNTPLTIVINRTADEELIKALINAGIDVNAVNDDGDTALLLAAKNNINPNISKAIIFTGTDIEQTDAAGRTPLLLAAEYNKNKNVPLLFLQAGAKGRQSNAFIRAVNSNRYFSPADKNLLLKEKLPPMVKIPWYNSKAFKEALASKHNLERVAARTDLKALEPASKQDASSLLKEYKDTEILGIFVKNGVNINTPDKDGKTMLHTAAQQGDSPWLKSLLQAKANPNTQAKDGTSPLYSALISQPKNKENIALLLKYGANPDIHSGKQKEPLLSQLIEQKADLELIEMLIKKGADINGVNAMGDTPLITAARNAEDEKIINLLLENKADMNIKNKQGFTALLTAAASNKNPEVTLTLLKKADSKLDTDHVLEFVQQNPNREVTTKAAKYILDTENAKIAEKEKNDTSIWFNNKDFVNALKTNNVAAIKKALSKKLSLDNLMQGQVNALMMAAAFSTTKEPVQLLVKAGAQINGTNNNGDTPLMTAAVTNPNLPAFEALIEAGADVNAADIQGNSILYAAASKNPNEKVPAFLIKNGAKVENPKILLQYAQKNPNKKVYELLKQIFAAQKGQYKKS